LTVQIFQCQFGVNSFHSRTFLYNEKLINTFKLLVFFLGGKDGAILADGSQETYLLKKMKKNKIRQVPREPFAKIVLKGFLYISIISK